MTLANTSLVAAVAVTTILLGGPAVAQQGQSPAQENSCRELIGYLQSGPVDNAAITLDQARAHRDQNDQQACRQALAKIAQRAHQRAGLDARVTARDFASRGTAEQGRPRAAEALTPSQYRHERGRLIAIQRVRVRGVNTPNHLLVIETRPGRRVVADIGQNTRGMDLRSRAPVAVRGRVVRVGRDKALLLADAVRVGDRTFDVDRPAYRRTAQN